MQIQSLPSTPPRRDPIRIQRAVLLALVVRELRSRVQGRWLSLLWLVFEPLVHVMLILALIGARTNAVMLNIELPVFLVTGLLPFFLFRNLARKLPSSISANRSLFAYRQVMPIDALIARAMVEIGLYAMVYLVALILLGWMGYHSVPHAPIELMAVTLVLIALGVGLGLLFAVAQHNRPKVATFIGFIFLPLYFASGVIFQLHNLAPDIRYWLLFNPVLHLVELSRVYFIPNYTVLPGVSLVYPATWALLVAALALSLYRVYRHRFVTVG
jgi:capsular polysaccharide transport system permease protein